MREVALFAAQSFCSAIFISATARRSRLQLQDLREGLIITCSRLRAGDVLGNKERLLTTQAVTFVGSRFIDLYFRGYTKSNSAKIPAYSQNL